MKRDDIKRRPLADTTIDALESEGTMYRTLHADHIYLRVMPSGSKDWQLRYKTPEGKWSWLGLGPYGKGSHQLTGQQVRDKARQMHKEAAARGVTLREVNAPPAPSVPVSATFASLAAEWLETKRGGWTRGTFERAENMLAKHVMPVMGHRAYAGIASSDWLALFKGLEALGILETSAKTRAHCRDVYAFARVTDRIQHNPLDDLHKFTQASRNEAFHHVGSSEVPALLRAIRGYTNPQLSIGLQLLAVLAVRPGELRQARWSDFDLDAATWTIPSAFKKERRDFVVPLPSQAVLLLQRLYAMTGAYPWVLPSRTHPIDRSVSNLALNQALNRLGYRGRQTPHGFRHLFATTCNEMGRDPRIVDQSLAHKVAGVEGTYNRAQYLTQRRDLLQWWADHLDALAASLEAVGSARTA